MFSLLDSSNALCNVTYLDTLSSCMLLNVALTFKRPWFAGFVVKWVELMKNVYTMKQTIMSTYVFELLSDWLSNSAKD
jgi:hypothetical protein